jgi:predicted DCC family thiol-disulfide oxidoreductase YuxK
MMSEKRKVVFFDGECLLCSGVVRWCHEQDRRGRLQYAALGGEFAAQYREELALPEGTGEAQTFVFWDEEAGKVLFRSAGAVALLKTLGGFWKVLGIGLQLIPRPVRDWGYGVVAKNRSSWFGRSESCELPPGSLRGQVLD